MDKKVDIIIVYWSTDFMIKKCINRILRTDYNNYKIYIVDNTNTSKSKLKSYFNSDKITIIKGASVLINNKKRIGYKRGRHHPEGIEIGLQETSSDYVALLHPDAWPIDDLWLKKCFNYLNRDNVNWYH